MLSQFFTHQSFSSFIVPNRKSCSKGGSLLSRFAMATAYNKLGRMTYATTKLDVFSRQMKPATTKATVRFFAGTDDSLDPVLDFKPGFHTSNLKRSHQSVVDVTDIRYFNPPTTLSQEGCEWVRSTTKLREADLLSGDAEKVKSTVEDMYYLECARLVSRRLGVRKAVAYHFRHREQKSDPDDIQGFSSKPVVQFHIDNDRTTAERNLRNTVGEDEAKEWMNGRWGIINVWRPLGDVVRQYPLALLDSRNYSADEAAVNIRTTNNYKSHFLGLKKLPEYKFYFVSNMAPDEALLFVDFDSGRNCRVSGLGHGAIFDHSSPADVPLRRSTEVRVLVLY